MFKEPWVRTIVKVMFKEPRVRTIVRFRLKSFGLGLLLGLVQG